VSQNSAGVEMSQLPPEVSSLDYVGGGYTHKQGTRVTVVVPFPEVAPNPYEHETKEEHISRKALGIGGPREVRGHLAIITKFPAIDKRPRTNDGPAGQLVCPHEGCDWWCSARNAWKLTAHESKKHGGA
jgi:hypothetical protein